MDFKVGAGPRLSGFSAKEDFSVSVVQTPTSSGGSSGPAATFTKDVRYTEDSGAGSTNLFRLDVAESIVAPGKSFVSKTPSICTVDANGQVAYVSNGLCQIDVVTPVGRRRFEQSLWNTVATVKTGVSELAAGSLIGYLTDQRNALLAQVQAEITAGTITRATAQRSYVNGDGSGGFNPSNMLKRADIAGWTACNYDKLRNWRYLTPKHSIHTAHVIGVGPYSTYYTMPDGSPVLQWTPTTQLLQGGSLVYRNDYGKVIDVDTAIVYQPSANVANLTKLPPANLSAYLPTCGDHLVDVPVWASRWNTYIAGEQGWVQAVSVMGLGGMRVPSDPTSQLFCQPYNGTNLGTGGDSGSAVFANINGEPMLLYSMSFTGGFGWCYASGNALINSTMNYLSGLYVADGGTDAANGTYAAQTVDLSAFNLY